MHREAGRFAPCSALQDICFQTAPSTGLVLSRAQRRGYSKSEVTAQSHSHLVQWLLPRKPWNTEVLVGNLGRPHLGRYTQQALLFDPNAMLSALMNAPHPLDPAIVHRPAGFLLGARNNGRIIHVARDQHTHVAQVLWPDGELTLEPMQELASGAEPARPASVLGRFAHAMRSLLAS